MKVRTHLRNRQGKSLFLGRRINAYVIGLPVDESEELLDGLWEHMVQDKYTWRQDWQVGDLICVGQPLREMHRRDAF